MKIGDFKNPLAPETAPPIVDQNPMETIANSAPGQKRDRAFVDQVINDGRTDTLQNTKDQYSKYMGQGPQLQLPDQMGMQVVGDALKNKIQSQFQTQVSAANASVQRNAIHDHQKKQGMVLDLANAKLRTEMAREAREAQAAAEKANKRKAVMGSILGIAGAVGGAMVGGPAGAQIGMGVGTAAGSQL